MKRLILYCSLVLLIPASLSAAPSLFDNFNSHIWENENGGWHRQSLMSYITFGGRTCIKLTTTDAATNAAFIRSRRFSPEDWSNVDLVRMDVYLECPASNTQLKLEALDLADGAIFSLVNSDLPTDTWVDLSWDINTAAPVARLHLLPDNLGTNECTYYFDNIRLVMNNGTTWYWDGFEAQPKDWFYLSSFVDWYGGNNLGVVSHNASTATSNAGAGYLQWSGTPKAELTVGPFAGADWSVYNTLKADVLVTTTTTPLYLYLTYSNATGESSVSRYVTQANTWQTVYWPLPAGADSLTVTNLTVGIQTSALQPSGTFYIDNIMLGEMQNLAVSKSTSAAVGLPGDNVSITLTYGNPGEFNVTNTYITEAIPFNSILQNSVAGGSAVEYYVGNSWQGSYSAAATKLRWKIDSISAGSSGQTVSYSIKIK